MLLYTLLRQFDPLLDISAVADGPVTGVEEDSRRVRPGQVFVARTGSKTDGGRYAADALARGAAVVITQTPLPGLPHVVVADTGAAVARLAQLFHGDPSRKLRVLGVTGTNGKTTTTYLIRHLLAKSRARCGMIGTVEIDDGRTRRPADMTTPPAAEIAALLAAVRDSQAVGCAMEVSSHALDQGRVAGVHFAAAGFTNLTGDHLDYHGTMENYATAKAALFEMLDSDAVAVVNAADTWSPWVIRNCRARVARFGFGPEADYRAADVASTALGTNFILLAPDGRAQVRMPLIGKHNIENALLAAALTGEAMGLTVHQIAAGLRDATGAPGRLQAVRAGQEFAVLVDYAHSDDALANVLRALRPLTRGKLRVMFGCGGDRDRTKRPRMAAIAQRMADAVYVTSDNPRTEEPQAIISEICAGFTAEGRTWAVVEPDRRAAIARVLNDAGAGDIVLLAGKGHENYQIVGTEKHHFDDVEEAMRVLASNTART